MHISVLLCFWIAVLNMQLIGICEALVSTGIRPDLGAERRAFEQGPLPVFQLTNGIRPIRKGSGKSPIHAGLTFLYIILKASSSQCQKLLLHERPSSFGSCMCRINGLFICLFIYLLVCLFIHLVSFLNKKICYVHSCCYVVILFNLDVVLILQLPVRES